MNRENLINRVAPAAALCGLIFVAAVPALAQGISGGVDPVQTGRTAVTLVLALLTVLAALAWAGAGAACFAGRIPVFYFWSAGVGTAVLAGCTFISNRLLGGGGLTL